MDLLILKLYQFGMVLAKQIFIQMNAEFSLTNFNKDFRVLILMVLNLINLDVYGYCFVDGVQDKRSYKTQTSVLIEKLN